MIDAAGNYACGDQASIINHVLERNNGQTLVIKQFAAYIRSYILQVYLLSARVDLIY
jgi:hypothetical protein